MNPYKNISYFKPYAPKVTKMGHNGSIEGKGIAFAFNAEKYLYKGKKFGVIIYGPGNREIRFDFSKTGMSGSIFGLCIEDDSIIQNPVIYNFFVDDIVVIDEYAYEYTGNDEFGVNVYPGTVKSVFRYNQLDKYEDISVTIPYEDAIFYGINVRSFTIDKSSGVKNKGTFEGVIQKLPYLKDLGITSLVLMPCYEYDECHLIKEALKSPKNIDSAKEMLESKIDNRLDLWGFTKGFYYAPKASYSACGNPILSFKELVASCHKEGIEIIMQIYFNPDMIESQMIDVLKFWSMFYHVDGFRICGFYINHRAIAQEPSLKNTKLWFDYIPSDCINDSTIIFRNLAVNNGNYKNDIRKFLKSDENLINAVLSYQKANPKNHAVVNYLCDYDGFTLYDLYSYERKHNEYNGEDNADGSNDNNSWNCGIEGESRKKAIVDLRIKQIKNALTFLFMSQGTPYIFSGDEFLNSRGGNNNAYCLDNQDGYVVWKHNKASMEICDFCKMLIKLRKDNRILHMQTELTNLDYKSLGSPDLSYHGIEAWRPELSYNSRMIGLFFNGDYAVENQHKDSCSSFYVGINMHWEKHRLAVPKLKKGLIYEKILDTANEASLSKDNEIPVSARSIVIYEVVKSE